LGNENISNEQGQLTPLIKKTPKIIIFFAVIMILTLFGWLFVRVNEARIPITILTDECIFCAGIGMGITLVILIFWFLFKALRTFRSNQMPKALRISWLFFIGFAAIIGIFLFKGFLISAIGLFGTANGFFASTSQSAYGLLRLFPYHPMVPFNALSHKLLGQTVDFKPLADSVWDFNILVVILGWCAFIGIIALILRSGRSFLTLIYLLLTGALLVWMYQNQRLSDQMMILRHCAVVLVLIWQSLIIYRTIRNAAKLKLLSSGEDGSKLVKMLPPGAAFILLIVLFAAPVMADMYNHFALLDKKSVYSNIISPIQPTKTM